MDMKTITEFDSLVDIYSKEIFGYLWRMLHNQQDTEDVFQETFIRAFRAYPKLRDNSNLRAWLYKIATNVAYTHYQRHSRIEAHYSNEFDPTWRNDVESRDLLLSALRAIRSLPHKQQSALMLRKYQGLSYEEIGEVLACSAESARANVYQAVKKLQAQFSKETL